MTKRCGFCEFVTDDEAAFSEHMRTAHGWGVTPAATPPPPPAVDGVAKFCGACGAPRDSASTNFCRNCGAPFANATPVTQEMSPAFAQKGGFWRRTGAYVLDGVVTGVMGFIVGIVVAIIGEATHMAEADMNNIAQLIGEIVGLVYFLYFWSAHGSGQTPGMRALRLRVIRTDGTYLSVGRAFLRNIGLGISIICLGLGVFWIGFDKQKQGWHDKIADTFVIRTA